MGGLIFTKSTPGNPALYCPRLPPQVYFILKARFTATLQRQFSLVATPREAPEKSDHGDVDFLVYGATTVLPGQGFGNSHIDAISKALGSVRSISPCSGTRSFAVPVPQLDDVDNKSDERKAYAQIDLMHCSTPKKLRWQMLTHSYGDLFQIIGAQLRPCGLSFKPYEFVGKVPRAVVIKAAAEEEDAEGDEKVKSLLGKSAFELTLSSDPTAVLAFLGLDEQKWESDFKTLDECFKWVVAGRLFDRHLFRQVLGTMPGEVEDRSCRQRRSDEDRKKLRPMYRNFVEDWLPAHPEIGIRPIAQSDSQRPVLDEALENFGKRDEYEELVAKLIAKQREGTFWSTVRKRIPATGKDLGYTMIGLKDHVSFDVAGMPKIEKMKRAAGLPQPSWTQSSSLSKQSLLAWVDENLGECRVLGAAHTST